MPEGKDNRLHTISRKDFDAVIFDLDGVVTRTARVHAQAWKKMFDPYLQDKAPAGQYKPFNIHDDYELYVDGKPRYEGAKSFLQSRGIQIPYGSPDDPPGKETVCGLGNKKNELFLELLESQGAETYPSTVVLVHELRAGGFGTAVISASKNCGAILRSAQLSDLFDAKVDGVDAERLGLKGKPWPDVFLQASRELGVSPSRAAVVEDSLAGVEAGRRGGFGLVIGVARKGNAGRLREKGADIVVDDLAQVRPGSNEVHAGTGMNKLPSALGRQRDMLKEANGRPLVFFLDYDGTLTPIVSRPELAQLPAGLRNVLKSLSLRFPVAIVSGRDLEDIKNLVQVDSMYYAGSHGFDITGPEGKQAQYQKGRDYLPFLDRAERSLRDWLRDIPGSLVERKRFSLAVHYRLVGAENLDAVKNAVQRAAAQEPRLRITTGKKVYDFRPDINWDKGKALLWLMEMMGLGESKGTPVYIGDDVTDEDAFKAIKESGFGIVVGEESRPTAARFRLKNPEEVRRFLEGFLSAAKEQDE
jgi:trehalose-phosphatase